MKTKMLFAGVALASVLLSCDKEQAAKPTAQNPATGSNSVTNTSNTTRGLSIPVACRNGRLVFESRDDFEKAMTELSRYSPAELTAWEDEFTGFTSLRSAYLENGINEDDLSTSADKDNTYIDALEFSTALNHNGIVQIGHRIYRLDFAAGDIYIIPDGDEEKIPYFDENMEIENVVLKRSLADTEDNEIYTVQYDGTWVDSDRCSENGMGNRYNISPDNTYVLNPAPGDGTEVRRQWAIVDYDRYGIYYTMKSRSQYQYRNNLNAWHGVPMNNASMNTSFTYKPRCRSQQSGSTAVGPVASGSTGWVRTHYSSTRALKSGTCSTSTTCSSSPWSYNPQNTRTASF